MIASANIWRKNSRRFLRPFQVQIRKSLVRIAQFVLLISAAGCELFGLDTARDVYVGDAELLEKNEIARISGIPSIFYLVDSQSEFLVHKQDRVVDSHPYIVSDSITLPTGRYLIYGEKGPSPSGPAAHLSGEASLLPGHDYQFCYYCSSEPTLDLYDLNFGAIVIKGRSGVGYKAEFRKLAHQSQ